jgi:hypothetical protein
VTILILLGKKDEAINFYTLGIEEYLLGLSIKLTGEADAKERGLRIQEKMQSNLGMALERIENLSKLLSFIFYVFIPSDFIK